MRASLQGLVSSLYGTFQGIRGLGFMKIVGLGAQGLGKGVGGLRSVGAGLAVQRAGAGDHKILRIVRSLRQINPINQTLHQSHETP